MAQVPFHHLVGADAWWRCDHRGTSLDLADDTVRLASEEEGLDHEHVDAAVIAAWRALRGALIAADSPPDRCGGPCWVRFSASGSVDRLGDGGWENLGALEGCLGASRDPYGRIWVLERDGVARLLAADTLRIIATVAVPSGATGIGCTRTGVLVAGAGSAWWMPYNAEWRLVATVGEVLAVDGVGEHAFVLQPGVLGVWDGTTMHDSTFVDLEDPLPLLALAEDEVLIGEIAGPPPTAVRFGRYRVTPGSPLARLGTWDVLKWDGIGLARGDTASGTLPSGTLTSGIRAFTRVRERYGWVDTAGVASTTGRVETFALDSERYGCRWHRVFLDVCAPAGTAFRVEARTSDTLPTAARTPEPPLNLGVAAPGEALAATPPLGSLTSTDNDGWVDIGVLDRRAYQVDVPGFRPDDDRGLVTLEGLLKGPPGRYLWLRISLLGTRRATPQLVAARASFPRPSLLDLLPGFWRADPTAAAKMEETLALFEGSWTELAGRVDVLPDLFDPAVTPALDWLATWLTLTLDPRLPDAVKRELVGATAELYRQRGTIGGLERLCGILGECEARVVESWSLRRPTGAVLLDEGAGDGMVLGPGLQIGGSEGQWGDQDREPWEVALEAAWEARRDNRGGNDHDPCPPSLPDPIQRDPMRAWYGRYAHRFSVLLFRENDAERFAIVDAAIEANKPAHTVHDLCFAGGGFRVGVNTLLGLGTVLGETTRLQPFHVGGGEIDPRDPAAGPLGTPLGPPSILGEPHPASVLSLLVGASRLGQTTLTG